MSLAPNRDVPANVSPFVTLPVLDLCAHCGRPVVPLAACCVVTGGVMHGPLCDECVAVESALW